MADTVRNLLAGLDAAVGVLDGSGSAVGVRDDSGSAVGVRDGSGSAVGVRDDSGSAVGGSGGLESNRTEGAKDAMAEHHLAHGKNCVGGNGTTTNRHAHMRSCVL